MPKISAGLLMYRLRQDRIQVLLVHPGGPLFQKKDEGYWTIPKGEIDPGEDLFETALREFHEETGLNPTGPFIPLSAIRQKGGKIVHAWAFAGDCDPHQIVSNSFTIEWPPKSGRLVEFPEVDRAEFFDLIDAKKRIKVAQADLLEELERLVAL